MKALRDALDLPPGAGAGAVRQRILAAGLPAPTTRTVRRWLSPGHPVPFAVVAALVPRDRFAAFLDAAAKEEEGGE